MKKLLSLFLVLALALTLAGPTQTISAATKYSINKSKLILYVGAQYSLKINGYSDFIMWKSSNAKVAAVSSKGTVKAKKEGTTTITATIGAGSNNKKFSCKVTVKNRLSTNKKSITCILDEFEELKIYLKNPKPGESIASMVYDAEVIDTEWGSSNKEYILNIIPKKIGYTEIKISTVEGSGWNEQINIDTGITIGVTVLEDNSGWISETALSSFDVSVTYGENTIDLSRGNLLYSDDFYTIENVLDKPEEGVVYTSNGISYKLINNELYFKISDLKKMKLMK
jgi:hypothetical protein